MLPVRNLNITSEPVHRYTALKYFYEYVYVALLNAVMKCSVLALPHKKKKTKQIQQITIATTTTTKM